MTHRDHPVTEYRSVVDDDTQFVDAFTQEVPS